MSQGYGSVYLVGPNRSLSGDGRKEVAAAGTAEALAASTPASRVVLVALQGNAGAIVVGASTVVAALADRQGVPIYAGERLEIHCTNLEEIFLDAETSGDGVSYLWEL
jgi:hypothetical protein